MYSNFMMLLLYHFQRILKGIIRKSLLLRSQTKNQLVIQLVLSKVTPLPNNHAIFWFAPHTIAFFNIKSRKEIIKVW